MDYKLEDIIDIPLLQKLQDKLNLIYSFPSAIIDNDGKILTAVAWQDICTKFHRINSESQKECIKSDRYITEHLSEANPAVSYKCPHGLIDNATPIIIDGKHLGNFFTGQFFLEKPDLDFFKKQAAIFGFDEKAYLAAVAQVPIWTQEKLNHYLDFIKGFIEIIANIGLKNLNAIAAQAELKKTNEELVAARIATTNLMEEAIAAKNALVITNKKLFKEVMERKRAEKSLRESNETLRIAQRLAQIGSWTWTVATNTVQWSEELCQINGHDPTLPAPGFEEMTSFYTPESWKRLNEAVAKALQNGESYELDLDLVRPDGGIRNTLAQGKVDYDASGKIVSLHGTVQDITERKRAEKENAKLEAQLQQARKMESVGRLAGGVAHDFNNMLGVIIGHTENAMGEVGTTHPLYASLEEIMKAAERSANLTRQLLAFARKQTVAPKVLDLNEIVTGMLKMLQRLIGEDIQLHWQPQVNLWLVKMDPSQIDQILANLCINARDAIADVGKLTIETENVAFDATLCQDHAIFVPGEYVLIAVSDNGCGMDKETLSHLFEPFFTTKDIGKSTGLGLATVYGIVKQNNGFINVYSEPGKGTTFKIYLPRHAQQGIVAKVATTAKNTSGHGETVLLVEDEQVLLEMAKLMLESLGYATLVANTPDEAIRLAEKHTDMIHLLITDVVMPGMNGRDLAKRIQSARPTMKCLFMSGYTANAIAHHGVLDEGIQFIQKPFSRKDLAIKIRAMLEESE